LGLALLYEQFRVQRTAQNVGRSFFAALPFHSPSGRLQRSRGIAALSKINELFYGGVLHASHAHDRLKFPPAPLPAPMQGVVLELTQRGDEKKLSDALAKLTAEDPSLRLEFDSQANETVLRGMGELHLRVVLDRMREEFNLEVQTRQPRIAYRETVTRKAEGHHRHKKQTGGAGQFGEVFLNIEPLPPGGGFEFVDKVVGGVIPSQFMPAVEKGVRQVLQEGAVAGYPLQDIRVTVYDGKHHPVDSKEVAFVSAGKKAFINAITRARPIVLEPIAKIEVTTPGQFMGDIAGHLSSSRGRINGNNALPGNQVVISAEAPVGELGDFQTRLKSLTGGEGADILLNNVGLSEMENCLMAAASNGRIMHIGANPVVHNQPPQEPPALTKLPNLILKNLTVRGIIVGSRPMFVDLIQAMVSNNIRPVIDRVFDWDDSYAAIEYMQSGKKIGKIVIRVT